MAAIEQGYDTRELDRDDAEFGRQDKRWNAPRFIGIGFVTLLVAVFVIVYASVVMNGCTVAIVP